MKNFIQNTETLYRLFTNTSRSVTKYTTSICIIFDLNSNSRIPKLTLIEQKYIELYSIQNEKIKQFFFQPLINCMSLLAIIDLLLLQISQIKNQK